MASRYPAAKISDTALWARGGLALAVIAVLIAGVTIAGDLPIKAKASFPGGEVRVLTAAHTGSEICRIADGTALNFLQRADHGPHKFAKVEVLEGACAGTQGFVALQSLDPQPDGD